MVIMTSATTPDERAFVVTGPTSGIGHQAALDLAEHGTVVLVGRNAAKLDAVATEITARGGRAMPVVGDFADITSARRAAREVAALGLPITGVLNNAGMQSSKAAVSAQGFELTFATNHLGPFAFTEELLPHLADGTVVMFVCSAVEDPLRMPAVMSGFRGARYISAEASSRGEWMPGGSKRLGMDAYATSKQANLATVFSLAREYQNLVFVGLEPGFSPGTGLGADAGAAVEFLTTRVLAPLAPRVKGWSTPELTSRVITDLLTSGRAESGTYYNETGVPMLPSAQVQDPHFDDRVVSETRALLATVRE